MDSVPGFSHEVVQDEKLAFVDPSRSRELKSGVRKLFYLHAWKQVLVRQFDAFGSWRLSVVSQRA